MLTSCFLRKLHFYRKKRNLLKGTVSVVTVSLVCITLRNTASYTNCRPSPHANVTLLDQGLATIYGHTQPAEWGFHIRAHVYGNLVSRLRNKTAFGFQLPKSLTNLSLEMDWWQAVSNRPLYAAYVYSAYLDKRDPTHPGVRVMSIVSGYATAQALSCVFFNEGRPETVVKAVPSAITDGQGFRFTSFILTCPLPASGNTASSPVCVSVIPNDQHFIHNLLVVRNRDPKSTVKRDFTVCVTPLNREYGDHTDNTYQYGEFLEFIEINNMFGADFFTIYNVSTGKSIEKHIKEYQAEGLIEIIHWQLPIYTAQDRHNEIHYYGQAIALNDCLYRNMYASKYITFIDLDEIIVPYKTKSWQGLLHSLPNPQGTSFYVFHNTFFLKEYPPDPESVTMDLVQRYKLRSLMYTKRENKIWPAMSRSKCIVQPLKIIVAGIHSMYSTVDGQRQYVAPESALLHHYRNWLTTGTAPYIENKWLYHFKDEILKRIHNRTNLRS